MDRIEVDSQVDQSGNVVPMSLIWKGESYWIDGVGRRWDEQDGEHILVMVGPNKRVLELLHDKDEKTWWMVKEHLPPKKRKV